MRQSKIPKTNPFLIGQNFKNKLKTLVARSLVGMNDTDHLNQGNVQVEQLSEQQDIEECGPITGLKRERNSQDVDIKPLKKITNLDQETEEAVLEPGTFVFKDTNPQEDHFLFIPPVLPHLEFNPIVNPPHQQDNDETNRKNNKLESSIEVSDYVENYWGLPSLHQQFINGGIEGWVETSKPLIAVIDNLHLRKHGERCQSIIQKVAPSSNPILLLFDSNLDTTEEICGKIQEAIDLKVKLICISGTIPHSAKMLKSLNAAFASNIIIVCSASNFGMTKTINIGYPAAYGHLICVGSHDSHGKPSSYTSVGKELDLLAPGLIKIDGKEDEGTSYAAPYMAGLIALILQYLKRDIALSIEQLGCLHIKSILRVCCTCRGDHSSERGFGAIDPKQFFEYFGDDYVRELMQHIMKDFPTPGNVSNTISRTNYVKSLIFGDLVGYVHFRSIAGRPTIENIRLFLDHFKQYLPDTLDMLSIQLGTSEVQIFREKCSNIIKIKRLFLKDYTDKKESYIKY